MNGGRGWGLQKRIEKYSENKSKESYRLECWHSYMTHGYNMRLNHTHPCTIIDLFYFPTLIFYLIFYSRKKKDLKKERKLNGDWIKAFDNDFDNFSFLFPLFSLPFYTYFFCFVCIQCISTNEQFLQFFWLLFFFFCIWISSKGQLNWIFV